MRLAANAASQAVVSVDTGNISDHWLLSLQTEVARRGATSPQVSFTATESEHAIAAVPDGSVDLGFVENPVTPTGLGTCRGGSGRAGDRGAAGSQVDSTGAGRGRP